MSTLHVKILKYTLLPGFIPRITGIFASGFAQIAYLIAIIYQSLRLLPKGHPYLNPSNIGHYGIRHVIAEAANNLVIDRKNVDQIIVFFTILVGIVLLFMQFGLLIATIVTQPAFAAIAPKDIFDVYSKFSPPGGEHPSQDLAFIILDRVFGMEGIFNSCVSLLTPCYGGPLNQPVATSGIYPEPFHIALHTMLEFYSRGIFVIAVFVIIYFSITIIAETAETGTPFGQRFNRTWVPIRLIVFFALLMPLNIGDNNAGLNGAQLVVFWSAKIGSNFATNALGLFDQTLTAIAGSDETPLGDADTLIAVPKVPGVEELTRFMFVAKTCQISEEWAYYHTHTQPGGSPGALKGINAYLVRSEQQDPIIPNPSPPEPQNMLDFLATPYKNALEFSNNGTIIIRFGSYNPNSDAYANYEGGVFPFCGEIKITTPNTDAEGTDPAKHSGSYSVQELYYDMLQKMWKDNNTAVYAECLVNQTLQAAQNPNCTNILNSSFRLAQTTVFENMIKSNLNSFTSKQIANGDWNIPDSIKHKGWAGAALWYNRIADLNGNFAASIQNLPKPIKYPYVLEMVADARLAASENVTNSSIFDPVLSSGILVDLPRASDHEIAATIYNAYLGWENAQPERPKTRGIIIDAINALFGTSGIFEIRSPENKGKHPLALLSSLGKSMMEASYRNLGFGFAGSLASMAMDGGADKTTVQASSDFLKTIGTTALAMSFVLSFVLPSLPFVYFLFAVSGWVKSIFEAIVAMPLWALAHISRIDGEGLPGPAATNGYFLILEIFLRPILTLFGLLASISLFSAMVNVLNDTFVLVVSNVAGNEDQTALDFVRGPIDEFFYTGLYVILCYMIGLGSFKLIDSIPNNILRWAGVTVSTIQEGGEEAAGQLSQKVYAGISIGAGEIKGGALGALG